MKFPGIIETVWGVRCLMSALATFWILPWLSATSTVVASSLLTMPVTYWSLFVMISTVS